jgi:UDP-glucuronate 4-epimerase
VSEILITGGAGFIGSHLTDRLLQRGDHITVLDNFNTFYPPSAKRANVAPHEGNQNFHLIQGDIRSLNSLNTVFADRKFDVVVHLAAMAGVRPSLDDPPLYMDVNVLGTQRLLDEISKHGQRPLLVFASSSSVYGERPHERFKETDPTDRPLSPYAASKIGAEAACYACHRTTGLNVISLRFFTVYGPRQRPDLAIHKFCDLINQDRPIEMYGDGHSKRDYTYITDIISGVEKATQLTNPGYEVINLGRSEPVELAKVIECLEHSLGKKANIQQKPPQPGDVPNTFADIEKATKMLGYKPTTSIESGIDEFVKWYKASKESQAAHISR